MQLTDLDPSLAVGLLCQSREDFDALCSSCAAIFARCLAPFSIDDAPPRIPAELEERASAGSNSAEDDDLCLL